MEEALDIDLYSHTPEEILREISEEIATNHYDNKLTSVNETMSLDANQPRSGGLNVEMELNLKEDENRFRTHLRERNPDSDGDRPLEGLFSRCCEDMKETGPKRKVVLKKSANATFRAKRNEDFTEKSQFSCFAISYMY